MILAVIPARGGSQGIKFKNIVSLYGRPLIHWTIDDALRSKRIDQVIVSTDSPRIANVSKLLGADVVMRPDELASDDAPSEWALRHALQRYPDTKLVVFLQATSPLRQAGDIDKAIDQLFEWNSDSLLSVSECHRFLWAYNRPMNYDPGDRPMRQNIYQFVETGSFYIFRPWVLVIQEARLGGRITMFKTPWWTSFEIDTMEDLALMEWLMERYHA